MSFYFISAFFFVSMPACLSTHAYMQCVCVCVCMCVCASVLIIHAVERFVICAMHNSLIRDGMLFH